MSQRETLSKPSPILSIGGVNERLVATELPPSDFSNVEGVFPQYAGMQTRLWGKRLLEKYASPIMGIAQFWTPRGYAQGVYQFEGSVDIGPWVTPTTNIVIPTLPPSPGIDGGMMTLDDFGNPYGGPISPPNICTVGFVGQNSAHVECGTEEANVGIPDDDNGGPAGQGKRCAWELVSTDHALPAVTGIMFGHWQVETDQITGPTPYPIYPNTAVQEPTLSAGSPHGTALLANCNSYSYKVNLGGGNWKEVQGADSDNSKGFVDFSAIIDPDDPPSVVEFRVRHNSGGPFVNVFVPVAGLDMSPGGNYTHFEVNCFEYLDRTFHQDPHPLGGGFKYYDYIIIQAVRTKRLQKVCA